MLPNDFTNKFRFAKAVTDNETREKERLQKELRDTKKIIDSTKETCKTLTQLVSDKVEIIAQQKTIIESCRCKSDSQEEKITEPPGKSNMETVNINQHDGELEENRELLEKTGMKITKN